MVETEIITNGNYINSSNGELNDVAKGIEERFNAAVNVIRGLPKNGSYQPSHDMMLRFYSYFKQAKLGPCTQKRPPFWDVVGRAKYDAYKCLGKMPKERAMELYVEELKKIIETMSYTDNVAEFMGSISELDGVDVDDLQAVAPDAIKKVRSQPNSPFASRETSPTRVPEKHQNGYANTNGHSFENDNGVHIQNGNADHSDDEYIDTVEDDSSLIEEQSNHYSRPWTRRSRSQLQEVPSNSHEPTTNGFARNSNNGTDLNAVMNQLLKTVDTMRNDVHQINTRINILERSLTEVKNHQLRKKIMELKHPKWWPFTEISPTWFFFMIVWPFLAQRLMNTMQRKK